MYIAEYNIGGLAWQQAAACLTYPRGVDAVSAPWWSRFEMLLHHLDAVPGASTSLRVQLTDRLRPTLFATAPASSGDFLRRALGSLTQLHLVCDGDVEYPRTRGEHDQLLDFPRWRCRVALPTLTSGEAWFAFDFRAGEYLDELLLEARVLEHAIGYHVNIETLTSDPACHREAARNALRVADVPGVSPALEQLQRTLSAKVRLATHICEEIIGVETPEAWEWLQRRLARWFCDKYGANLSPMFAVEDGAHEGSLVATRHESAFDNVGVDEICSSAITAEERVALLSWQPGRELLALLPATIPESFDTGSQNTADFTGLPEAYEGEAEYIFISYKRTDLDKLKAPVSHLERLGHRFWYDRDIPGGAEWDALIEERLQNCSMVLLFLSQDAVRSKYVRREVKFADALDKPIVAVKMHPDVTLSHGLAMLSNQYQVINGFDPAMLDAEIRRATRFHARRRGDVAGRIAGATS